MKKKYGAALFCLGVLAGILLSGFWSRTGANRAEAAGENAVMTESYEELYAQAVRAIEQEDWQNARTVLQKAEDKAGNTAQPYLTEARVLLHMSQEAEACRVLEQMPDPSDETMPECAALLEETMTQLWDKSYQNRQLDFTVAAPEAAIAETLFNRMQYYPNDGVRNLIKIYQRSADDAHRWAALNAIQQYYQRFARFSDDQDREMIQIFQQAVSVPEIVEANGRRCLLPVLQGNYWYERPEEAASYRIPAELGNSCEIRERDQETEIWDTRTGTLLAAWKEGAWEAGPQASEEWRVWAEEQARNNQR